MSFVLLPLLFGCSQSDADKSGNNGAMGDDDDDDDNDDDTDPNDFFDDDDDDDDDDSDGLSVEDCYPAFSEPMALNETLPPYWWDRGIRASDRSEARVHIGEMAQACEGLGDIDWSPFDVLLFVSIPAW